MQTPRRASGPLPALLFALLCTGCGAVGRDYVRPAPPSSTAWAAAPEGTAAAPSTAELATWWKVFRDPLLDTLIEKALAANPDLRVAEARVREVRAQAESTGAALLPRVGAGSTVLRARENAPPAPPDGVVIPIYRAGFDSSWELDLFGGVRRGVEAAQAEAQATEESRNGVLVTLLGDVARHYVELRGFQQQLARAGETVAAQRDSCTLTAERLAAGLTSELDLARVTGQLALFEAQVPPLEGAVQRTLFRLATLVGEEPGALAPLLSAQAPVPAPPPEVNIGLPAELLLRRPDVRRAERELAAATARVGVAEADLYPRFSLFGSFGLQSFRFGDLADWSSRVWSLGPSVRWSLFEGGKVRANIRAQNARQEQALARYDKALLTALEDVDGALVSFGKEEERRRSLAAAVAANTQVLETANALSRAGLADSLPVLDAQRALASSQAQLAQSQTAVTSHLVALYKALGGGWENAKDPAPR